MEQEYIVNGNCKRKATRVICTYCGVDFLKRSSLVKDNNFCNKKCYGKWIKKDRRKICEKCGCEYQSHKNEQRFCSVVCASSRIRSIRCTGDNKPSIATLHKSMMELGWDGNCMIDGCDYNNCLDNHRIVDGVDGGLYRIDNICVLCPNHHAELHRLNKDVIGNTQFIYNFRQ